MLILQGRIRGGGITFQEPIVVIAKFPPIRRNPSTFQLPAKKYKTSRSISGQGARTTMGG